MAVIFTRAAIAEMMRSRIRALAGEQYDSLEWSTLNLQIEGWAEALAQLAMYDEFLTRETAWETAENYYSLRAQMKLRGYKPKRMKGATGYLIFSTNPEIVKAPSWSASVRYEKDDYVVLYNATSTKVELYKSIWENIITESGTNPDVVDLDSNIGYSPSTSTKYWQRVDCRFGYDIPIPLGTAFSGAGGLNFTSTAEAKLLRSEEYVIVPVKQGLRKSARFSFTNNVVGGVGFPSAEISDRNIDQEFYFLTVGGVQYTEVQRIYEAAETDTAFEVLPESNRNTLALRFGNDQFGARPPVGEQGNLIYLETEGVGGEVYLANSVTTVKDTMYYTASNGQQQSVVCYCANPGTLTGGYNGDTLEDIRSGATAEYQSQNRMVTLTDYQQLLSNHASVGKCLVWSEQDDCEDDNKEWDEWVVTNQNKIHICGYDQSGTPFTSEVQQELLDYVKERKSPMDVIVFEDVESIGLIFSVKVFVSSTAYALEDIRQQVNTLLATNYSAVALGFRTPLYETAWKGKISQIEGVAYHNSSVKLSKEVGLDGDNGSSLAITTQLPFTQVRPTSYELWMQLADGQAWVKIAYMTDSELVWAEGYDTDTDSSPSQMTATGKIEITHIAMPAGADPSTVNFRIVYDLETALEVAILDVVPTRRNEILNFIEARSLTAEYT